MLLMRCADLHPDEMPRQEPGPMACLSELNDRLISQGCFQPSTPAIKHVGRCTESLHSAGVMPWKSKSSS
jgi:hypothetical protein